MNDCACTCIIYIARFSPWSDSFSNFHALNYSPVIAYIETLPYKTNRYDNYYRFLKIVTKNEIEYYYSIAQGINELKVCSGECVCE